MSSSSIYYYGWSDIEITAISFYSFTLLVALVVSVLCCALSRRFAPFARPAGLAWLLTAALLCALTHALFVATMVVNYYYLNDYYGYNFGTSARHLSAVGSLFGLVALASVLFTQFELALGVKLFSAGGKPTRRISAPRILAILAFVLIIIIDLAYFGVYEGFLNLSFSSGSLSSWRVDAYDLYRASFILSFVVRLLLFLFAFGVLLFTCMTPSVAGTRRARNLLIAAATLSLIWSLYSLILSGIYSLAPWTNLTIEYPYWLPAISTVFDTFLLALTLALILAAATTKTEEAAYSQPVVWSQQAYAPPSHVQHAI